MKRQDTTNQRIVTLLKALHDITQIGHHYNTFETARRRDGINAMIHHAEQAMCNDDITKRKKNNAQS